MSSGVVKWRKQVLLRSPKESFFFVQDKKALKTAAGG